MFEKLKAALRPKPVAKQAAAQQFEMYDTTEVNLLPRGGGNWAVAGYVGGSWPTFHDLPRLYPGHRKLSIAVGASLDAECLDVEPGDATIAETPGWVRRQHARGVKRPVLYISLSSAQGLVGYLSEHGIPRSSYWLWTAHYTYRPHVCSPACGNGFHDHADATQWTDRWQGSNVDASLCQPWFLGHPAPAHPQPAAKPAPKPAPGPVFPTEPQYPNYVLKPGKHDTGGNHKAVSCIQTALKVKVDGKYGPKTAAAVKAFQTAHKLPATGNVDKKTWTAIFHKPLK